MIGGSIFGVGVAGKVLDRPGSGLPDAAAAAAWRARTAANAASGLKGWRGCALPFSPWVKEGFGPGATDVVEERRVAGFGRGRLLPGRLCWLPALPADEMELVEVDGRDEKEPGPGDLGMLPDPYEDKTLPLDEEGVNARSGCGGPW